MSSRMTLLSLSVLCAVLLGCESVYEPPAQKRIDAQTIEQMNQTVQAQYDEILRNLESVHDAASASAALAKIQAAAEKIKSILPDLEMGVRKLTYEEGRSLHFPSLETLRDRGDRIYKQRQRIMGLPDVPKEYFVSEEAVFISLSKAKSEAEFAAIREKLKSRESAPSTPPTSSPGFVGTPQTKGDFAAMYGAENVVTVVLHGMPKNTFVPPSSTEGTPPSIDDMKNDPSRRVLNALRALVVGIQGSRYSISNGRHVFQAAPVSDVQAFAAKLTFGQVLNVDLEQRQIDFQVDMQKLPPEKK